uniref:Uncharacterized protein n=1 Tax=Lactuca sativa TaxID=4236 RepID=A0A9R1XBU5_LACSA|nr:hypothetical protein LSAT_V11C500295720 [Lactuca sativa]
MLWVLKVRAHNESCRAVRFINEGRVILIGSPDCSIIATDIETGPPVARLENSHKKAVNMLVNLTETTIASRGDEGHIKYITDMIFEPDSMKLLGPSGDGTLSVCNLRSSKVQTQSEFFEDEPLSMVIMKRVIIECRRGLSLEPKMVSSDASSIPQSKQTNNDILLVLATLLHAKDMQVELETHVKEENFSKKLDSLLLGVCQDFKYEMMNIAFNMDENTTGEDVEHNPKVSVHVDDAAVLCEVDVHDENTYDDFIPVFEDLKQSLTSCLSKQGDKDSEDCLDLDPSKSNWILNSTKDKTSNDDVGVTVVDPDETMPEYEGFTIDEKELENAEGGGGIDFVRLELPSSPIERVSLLGVAFNIIMKTEKGGGTINLEPCLTQGLYKSYASYCIFNNRCYWSGNIDTVTKLIDLESLSGVTKEEWRQVRHTFKKNQHISCLQ